MTKKRILVIGAGASGLTAIQACKEEDLDVICCERSGDFGGVWRYRDKDVDGLPSVMKSTVSNSSKEMTSFSNFPAPSHFPMYLPHTLVMKYLEMYCEKFDLLSSINYHEEVLEMIPSDTYGSSGQWSVKIRNLQRDETREEIFDGVAVCTGHHAYPHMPFYPGLDLFSGKVIHSHSYKNPNGLEDKRVLVVGAGNSGADIAVELSGIAQKVYLSTRRGAWIYPRNLKKGKPLDTTLNRRYFRFHPLELIENRMRRILNDVMDHKKFGIYPHHRVTSQHPTINESLLSKLSSGEVTMKRDVKEFTENGARFDGEAEEDLTPLDVVIFATGYDIKFPFLSDDIVRLDQNEKVFLFKNMLPPQLKHPSLAVIGLVQPNGSLFPVFEMQSRWFVALVNGKCSIPNSETMIAETRKVEDFRNRSFIQSHRHSIEVNWIAYLDDIAEKIGVKPNLSKMLVEDPKLFRACIMGPCFPYQYRLVGPHKWDGARDAIMTYKSRLYGSQGSKTSPTVKG